MSRMSIVHGTMTQQTGSGEFPVWRTMAEMTGRSRVSDNGMSDPNNLTTRHSLFTAVFNYRQVPL